MIRYENMRIDRALIKEYQKQLDIDLRRIEGLNDIDLLRREFEKIFANYIGTKHALALNSGTDALQLALLGLGVKKGDSVIVPNITYPAVALTVIYLGATPIFVDAKEEDLQIDESLLEKKIKKNTKAIILAHMFSRAGNIPAILKIAKTHRISIVEDCCQAESSQYRGKKLGVFGDISCFSFSYYKPLSSCGGGGGMVCFNKDKYRRISDYTKVWKDDQVLLKAGQRFAKINLLDLSSVKVKFKYLKKIIESRIKAKDRYEKGLEGVGDIKIFKDNKDNLSIPQNFVIFSKKRDMLGEYLEKNGINWQRPYTPLHLMENLSAFREGDFPVSNKYYNQAIQLPLFSFVKEKEVELIVDLIKKFKK